MNVYDFDGAIYDGNSSIDFFKYCICKNKKCLLVLPKFLMFVMLYLFKIVKKEQMKSVFFSFVKYFSNIDQTIVDFWIEKEFKLKEFYLKQNQQNDIVISASPMFLLNPMAQRYNFTLIASIVDKNTGKFISKNCYGEEKVLRFQEKFKNCKITNFYSDSLSDKSFLSLADKSFMIKGDNIIPWSAYKTKYSVFHI